MKYIEGYVRQHPNGGPLANIPVTVRDEALGGAIPVGGMWMASANPINTDANGFFSWSCELSPGPVRVEADVASGTELKVRSGKEVMQAGDIFISDVGQILLMFSPGVFRGVKNGFAVTAVTGQLQVTVATGAANALGRFLSTDTTRTLTIDPNTTLATRYDLVVLEQHVGGTYKGRQNIAVLKGTVDATVPTTNTNPDIHQIPISRVTIAQNATSVTVLDQRVYASPTSLGAASVDMPSLAPDVISYINSIYPGVDVRKDLAAVRADTKILNVGFGLNATAGGAGVANIVLNAGLDDINGVNLAKYITPNTASAALMNDGTEWVSSRINMNHIENTIISNPQEGHVMTWTSGAWRNAAFAAGSDLQHTDTNFGSLGTLTGTAKLGQAAVTLNAGRTYLLETQTHFSARGTGGSGTFNVWLQGNGTPQGGDQSLREFQTVGGVPRMIVLTGRRKVTPAVQTSYTAEAWVQHISGDYTDVRSGTVYIVATS